MGYLNPTGPHGQLYTTICTIWRPTEEITDELRRRLGDVVWSIDRRDDHGDRHTLHLERGAADALAGHLEAVGGDVERLKQLHRAAIQVPSLDAFRRLLETTD